MQRDTQSPIPASNESSGLLPNTTLHTSHDVHSETTAPGLQISSGVEAALVPARKQGIWKTLVAIATSNTRMTIGLCVIAFFILLALFGPLLTHQGPEAMSNDAFQAPSLNHWLGTTQEGQDIFSRLVYGAHVSLLISFSAAAGATAIALVVGLLAGYCGGWVDDVLTFITNIFLILPGLPLAIVIATFSVKGSGTIIFVLLITGWAWGARVLRALTSSMRQREFIVAARTMGENLWRIIFFEILPNEIAIVASSFVGTFIYAALAEVALEFLGLGDPNIASWGTILYWAQTNNALLAGGWWEFVPPGLCVAILCAGLSFVNFGIDELANPALRSEGKRRKQKNKKAVA